ncbi:LysR substrate-binding domain-containing protein [Variovorax sp. J31P179]|uniref:LysR family transcriptional regulator n=1 Tax=Variovorax sp. J31P179 TaxID=3053508 RepID=UPI002577D113|nr:LysR family transcriptional regulator [Variovorax sp. J31P179]MDM0081662.1 LysR substrate-binding domain-containing protein [Variovorax sp. J31P179]
MRIENIADLQVLVHTARGGTLTAAAAALGITPAAASATLKRLESQLGARLFERSTRAMRLTPQGQTLLDYAVRAFELLAEGESLVQADRGALVGTVRVAAPSDLTRVTLLPWFDDFLALHPGLQLALSVGDRPLDVMRDEVDLALRYGPLADSRLVARRLADSRPALCASPAYLRRHPAPQTPHDLLQHNCLTFHRGGRRQRLWRFARQGHWTEVRVDGDRVVDDASLAREWVLAGHGITLKSELDLQRDVASGALVRLLPDWDTEPYPLHALLPSGRFVPARVRALVDFLALKFTSNPTPETGPKITA